MQKISALLISVIFLITPIIAVLLGAIFNNERYEATDLIAISTILIALGLFNRRSQVTNQSHRP
ncbi:MAG: hypothetical protein AAF197_09140, partial [Pseudomonadota bacterium]